MRGARSSSDASSASMDDSASAMEARKPPDSSSNACRSASRSGVTARRVARGHPSLRALGPRATTCRHASVPPLVGLHGLELPRRGDTARVHPLLEHDELLLERRQLVLQLLLTPGHLVRRPPTSAARASSPSVSRSAGASSRVRSGQGRATVPEPDRPWCRAPAPRGGRRRRSRLRRHGGRGGGRNRRSHRRRGGGRWSVGGTRDRRGRRVPAGASAIDRGLGIALPEPARVEIPGPRGICFGSGTGKSTAGRSASASFMKAAQILAGGSCHRSPPCPGSPCDRA